MHPMKKLDKLPPKREKVETLNTLRQLSKSSKALGELKGIAQEKEPKIYRKELIELLFEKPYSKIEFVVEKLNVERKAASRYLQKLEKIGIVTSQKIGRESIYVNENLIQILKQN